jgi:transposase
MGKRRKDYTKEFKEDAVKLVIEQGYSITEVGSRLGINSNNVSRWVREYRRDQEAILSGGKTQREIETENRELRKENQRLKMERDILKKAAAFFAKESC